MNTKKLGKPVYRRMSSPGDVLRATFTPQSDTYTITGSAHNQQVNLAGGSDAVVVQCDAGASDPWHNFVSGATITVR